MSHSPKAPPLATTTADLPEVEDGVLAYDITEGKPVARVAGAWSEIAGEVFGTPTVVYDDGAAVGNTDQIQGNIPSNWKNNETSLKGLVIGTSCTSIGDNAFDSCLALTGGLVIPDSVTSIGSYAFNSCIALTGSLTIGNSVTSIGVYAFADTTFGGAIVIPDSVTSIGSYAFYYCNSFSSLYVNTPASSWVGSNALTGAGLTTIYVNGVTALGYTSGAQTFQGKSLTIAEWTNYPNIP